MPKTKVPISRNIEIKRQFTDADKLALLQQISDTDKGIDAKQAELALLKDQVKAMNEAIAGQYEIISQLCSQYRLGYESKWTECTVVYNAGMATFTDAKTGEVVEERPITEEEQLQLSEGRIDAENIIRESSKE